MEEFTMKDFPKKVMPPKDKFWGPLTGHILQLRDDRLKLMENSVKNYGEFIHFKYLKHNAFLIPHPDAAHHVLHLNASNYSKRTLGFKRVVEVGGSGILVEEGPHWKKMRKIIQPYFIKKSIESYLPVMLKIIDQALAQLNPHALSGQEVNLNTAMTRVTINVLGHAIFDRDFSKDTDFLFKVVTDLFEITNEKMTRFLPFPTMTKIKNDKVFKQSKKELDAYVIKLIEEAKKRPQGKLPNLIHTFMKETDGISLQNMLDEVLTLIIAGFETSANSLNWAFVALAENPEFQEKIMSEYRLAITGDKKLMLEDLPFTQMVIKESLRRYPGFWVLARKALADDEIFGEKIPANSIVLISPYLIQNNPKWWPDPEKFDPLRFTPEMMEIRDKNSYLPFGLGPRGCIASEFSLMEMTFIVAKFCHLYHFDLANTEKIKVKARLSLRTDQDVRLILRQRH